MVYYLRRKCPSLKLELDYFWPGMLGVSKDFVPLAGQDKINPNLYYVGAATGLSIKCLLAGTILMSNLALSVNTP
jgi:glycine/D-amino acid oxidase-like deaminating enzyme